MMWQPIGGPEDLPCFVRRIRFQNSPKSMFGTGLFEREARAMVETWKDSWFQPGTRLFYIVPRLLVDDVLPLRIDPAPAAVQRLVPKVCVAE